MKTPDARKSGTFKIGGTMEVVRLGFGTMRLTGKGIWGPPADHARAIAALHHARKAGVNFFDTADSYGPFVAEDFVHDALHPYRKIVIATKGGLTRHGPDIWKPVGNPDYLRQCVLMSMRRLGVKTIDLWQLHRIGPDCDVKHQFEAIKAMQKEGLIQHVGLSEVDVKTIKAAEKYFKVATVQNRFNLVDRTSEDVLEYCEKHHIGFIPWAPLAAGALADKGSVLDQLAKEKKARSGQIALAWLLARSPVMLPIPGSGDPSHVDDNIRAVDIRLSKADIEALDAQGRDAWEKSRKEQKS